MKGQIKQVSAAGFWFNYVVRRPAPRYRLFCLSGAGTGPSEFVAWRTALPDHAELWPIQLPGRERRLREEPLADAATLVSELLAAIEEVDRDTPLPIVLFGHSFGALVVFELARRLVGRDPERLLGVVVSGLAAPDRPARRASVADLDDDELLAWIRRLGGTPQELLEDERFARWLLRDLRASFRIRENYHADTETLLPCPVVAFGGTDDFEANALDLDAWSKFTSAWFRRHTLPGGHFFARESRERFLELLAGEVDKMAERTIPGKRW
ncbi:alpha/beta fold hydrolase [Nocardia sp. NPDC004568]|uniref:thioesterase II family protein n=1 Tax=Nocardia sp. NPDC004568 TaxID=3154551 RepID=UPI0033A6F949